MSTRATGTFEYKVLGRENLGWRARERRERREIDAHESRKTLITAILRAKAPPRA